MIPVFRFPRQNRTFVNISLADAIASGIFAGAVLPFSGVIARRLGASAEMLLILSVAQFTGFLLSFISTRLSARMPWSSMMLTLRILSWVPLLFLGYVSAPVPFVLILAGGHMSGAVAHAFFHAVIRDSVREQFRAGIMTMQRVSTMLLALPLAWLAGRLLDLNTLHYQYLFPVCAIGGILLALPFRKLPRGRSQQHGLEHPPGMHDEWRVFIHDKPFRAFMLSFFIGTLGEKIGMPLFPIFFTDELNLSYEQVGIAMGMAGPILAVGGYLFWGAASRKIDPLTITCWAMLLKALRPALWATASRWEQPQLAIVIGEGIFRWMVAGIEVGSVLSVLRFSTSTAAPIYVGIHFILMGIRGLIGPLIGWALYRTGVPLVTILWIISAIVAAGGIQLFILRHTVLQPRTGNVP